MKADLTFSDHYAAKLLNDSGDMLVDGSDEPNYTSPIGGTDINKYLRNKMVSLEMPTYVAIATYNYRAIKGTY